MFDNIQHKDFNYVDKKPYPSRVHTIEYGSGFKSLLTGFEDLRKSACKIVLKHFDEWELKFGFILLGNSQGGLIARSLLSECDPKVTTACKRLILIGVPNLGVSKIPILKE